MAQTQIITGPIFFRTAQAAKAFIIDSGYTFDAKVGCWLNAKGEGLNWGRSNAGHSVSVA